MPTLLAAMGRSAQLAALALILTIPISILAGVYAARRRDRPSRPRHRPVRRDVVVDPRIRHRDVPRGRRRRRLGWLPVLANPPPGAGLITTVSYLLMPALAMAIVYFGYIARMARAGTIEVLQSDYVRTADDEGATRRTRSSAATSCAMRSSRPWRSSRVQIGYLFGGIIGVEKIFNYNGMGQLMLFAAQRKDIPMLTAGALVIGIVYMVATLIADLIIAWMNPRIRLEEER